MNGPYVQTDEDGTITVDADGSEMHVATLKLAADTIRDELFRKFPGSYCKKIVVRIEFVKP